MTKSGAEDVEPARRSGPIQRMRKWLAHAVLLPELSLEDAHALRKSVQEDGALTRGYMLMCALSAGIATLGLLQSSTAVVIGAMLVSPLMGPIAALGFGFSSIDGHRIRDAARVVLIGAVIGIVTAVLITWLSPIRNATPEILARTQPTLLDLAIALLSGIAGGYATVMQRGGTAIGVAIATALMPPLATIGYGIGVFQIEFALGALLLFLTNLSAIAFAFALIARLSGAARPLRRVEWTSGYTFAAVAAFLTLATPLAMTLMRVSHEAAMRSAAREEIAAATGASAGNIAQLEVAWPLFGDPHVEAVVISPNYVANASQLTEASLTRRLKEKVAVNLQQVIAADLPAQTRAMVDAAMERTTAGIAADVPPFVRIRASIGLPTRGIWANRAERVVNVEPVPAPGWTLADYRDAERLAEDAAGNWTVRILPPPTAELRINLDSDKSMPDTVPIDLAIWALRRWGMAEVYVVAGKTGGEALAQRLEKAGIKAALREEPGRQDDGSAVIEVYTAPPSQRAKFGSAASDSAPALPPARTGR